METRINNQTEIADNGNLLKTLDVTTKLAQIASTLGIQAGALNRLSVLEILMYFDLVIFL